MSFPDPISPVEARKYFLDFHISVDENHFEEQDSDDKLIETAVVPDPAPSGWVKKCHVFWLSASSPALRDGIVLPNIGPDVSSQDGFQRQDGNFNGGSET
jgi:hypothetical protein